MKKLIGHPNMRRTIIFLLVLTVLLKGLSWLSIELGLSRDPLYNYSTPSFFDEAKESVDVLAIGTSSVYSSVAPLYWWNGYGITGYAWGEASQRIFETYEYLKKIYKVQSPKVVFLEVGDLYRDDTRAQVLDSMVKTQLVRAFPVVIYHRNLQPGNFGDFGASRHSVTKGYLIRKGTTAASNTGDYMVSPKGETDPVDPLCSRALKDCVELCRKHGSQVILLAVPDRSVWTDARHDTVETLAEKMDVPFLDLNLDLGETIDWKTDTPDGGTHLNIRGAEKVTAYLGEYLHANYDLPDHRGDDAFQTWEQDWETFAKALNL